MDSAGMQPQHNNSSARAVLLQLSQTLLAHSHLPHTPYQAAWGIATQHFISLGLPATAANLSVALGTCTTLSQLLQHQLIVLVGEHHVITALLECLDHTLAAGDHTAAAALVRAVHSLALLQLEPQHAATGSPLALELIWNSSQHRQRLLQAACSSAAGAEAVAVLAVAAASHGLPAAALLQDLLALPVSPQHSMQLPAASTAAHGSSSTSSIKAWVAGALEPLLLQIQQQLPLPVQSAALAHSSTGYVTHPSDTLQTHTVLAQQCTAFQQLWLLLWTAARITDGQLLSSTAVTAWDTLLQDRSMVQAVHAALLQPTSCCAAQQPDQDIAGPASTTCSGSPNSSSSSSSSTAPCDAGAAAAQDTRSASSNCHGQRSRSMSCGLQSAACCRMAALRGPTLSLLTAVAAHSASLAQQCFNILAPVLPEVLVACEPCSSSCCCPPPAPAAPARPEEMLSASQHGTPASRPLAQAALEEHAAVAAAAAPAAPAAAAAAATTAAPVAPAVVHSAAEARAAVLQVWQQQLLKGRSSFPGALHSLLQQWLPTAVEALVAAAAAAGQTPPPSAAAAASRTGSSAGHQGLESPCRVARAAAVSAALVPLAWQLQAARKPLLCAGGPAGFVSLITPHVPALLGLLQSAAAAAAAGGATAAGLDSVTDTAPPGAEGASRPGSTAGAVAQQGSLAQAPPAAAAAAPNQWVLLLATWLLHSWVAALQRQQLCGSLSSAGTTCHAPASSSSNSQPYNAGRSHISGSSASTRSSITGYTTSNKMQEPGQVQHTAAAIILSHLGPQMVQAAAALVAVEASQTLQVRCHIKALDLAQAVLAAQAQLPACTQPYASPAAAGQASLTAHAEEPGCAGHVVSLLGATMTSAHWEQLLAALGVLFARCPRDPMSLAHRQLLQTACQLLSGLAQHKLQPLAAAGAAAGALPADVQGSAKLNYIADATAQQATAATVAATELTPAAKEVLAAAAAPCNRVVCVSVMGSSQQRVWQGLCRDLGVLHEDLTTRKTARSSSREELLQAVGETLELLLTRIGSRQ